MKCNYCGAENKADDKFCSSCGAELTAKKKTTKKVETENVENKEVKEEKPITKTNETTKTITDGKSTASLVLGICSFVIFCLMLPLSLIGLILGIASKERSGKRTAGIVVNAIGLGLSLIATAIMLLFGAAISAAFSAYKTYDNNKSFFDTLEEEIEKADEQEEKKDVKKIGDDHYGYVEVPTNWIKFQDLDSTGTYQYTDIGDKGYIITLMTYEQDITPYTAATNINNHIKEEGNEANITFSTIGKYTGYVVHAKYTDGTYLDAYLFKADDDKLHYVSIEGPDKDNDNFDIPDTFTLEK